MKIAVGSDGTSHLTDFIIDELKKRGYEIKLFGALAGENSLWPKIAHEVAKTISSGVFDQGVLLCWTGTGVSIAANKVKGIRAALCRDAETAKGARVWNDANILVMSLRATPEAVAREILDAWFSASASSESEDIEALRYLKYMDENKN